MQHAAHPQRSYVRRFNRKTIDKRIRVIDQKSGVAVHGRCMSLCEGGFGAVLAGQVPELEMVAIEFLHPAVGHELRLIARVRHQTGFHYGFEFIAPGAEVKSALAELLGEDADFTSGTG